MFNNSNQTMYFIDRETDKVWIVNEEFKTYNFSNIESIGLFGIFDLTSESDIALNIDYKSFKPGNISKNETEEENHSHNDDEDDKISDGAIAAIVICLLAALGGAIGGLVYWLKCVRKVRIN